MSAGDSRVRGRSGTGVFQGAVRLRTEQVLEVRGLSLGFGDRPLFEGFSLSLPPGGIDLLVGPPQSGKTVLLNWLTGRYARSTQLRSQGGAFYEGAPLEEGNRPVLGLLPLRGLHHRAVDCLLQPLRETGQWTLTPLQWQEFALEWVRRHALSPYLDYLDHPLIDCPPVFRRAVTIASRALPGPALLLLDDPLAGLAEEDARWLADWLQALSGSVQLLMAAGETSPLRQVADRCHSLVSASSTAPSAPSPAEASPAPPKPEAMPGRCADNALLAESVGEVLVRDRSAPPGFHWIVPGKLAVWQRTGALEVGDLPGLTRLGIHRVVSLSDSELDLATLARHGLFSLVLPLAADRLPSIPQMHMLLLRMERALKHGETLVVQGPHGPGRGSLLLAAWLVRNAGLTPEEAMQRLRQVDPSLVMTGPPQEALLFAYAQDLSRRSH